MITPHIRAATITEAREVADLFARAYEHDPVWAALAPRADRRTRTIRRVMRAELLRGGVRTLDVATDPETGRIIGALSYEAPRHRTPAHWWDRFTAHLPGCIGRALRHDLTVRNLRPSEPHWYLHDIAADPGHRGQGIGSALLRHRLGLIDQAPTPAALQATTTASARLYGRYGFAEVAPIHDLPGVTSFALTRPARPARPAAPPGPGRSQSQNQPGGVCPEKISRDSILANQSSADRQPSAT
ncbi:GNAT family N-acetyltransferase [Kineosporia succinea]|uniref:Ribosomal protein S18 acetylase RimI-like enzyme n=1 Tax=Kineosporia succinea TaxID=84632 RepID=A0ABT9PEX4_9ACTN|nr:GNAT family N-acetyltransferase [Kineosporia succinea]MDP9831046.1 ribosomal protein S18 acetylase RimI-like enzyme [Kineosporia succinea]